MDLEKLKFPIGRFQVPQSYDSQTIKVWISEIASLPERLKAELMGITDAQLDTPYRPEGWTVRQVIHHLADSHMNGLIRTKLALTESNPTIKPYMEDLWANGIDYALPIESSLQMLSGIHFRWSQILSSLSNEELNKTFFHPEHQKSFDLKLQIANYAWHSNHHLAHVALVTKK